MKMSQFEDGQEIIESPERKIFIQCLVIVPILCTCLVLTMISIVFALYLQSDMLECKTINGGAFRGRYSNGTYTDVTLFDSRMEMFNSMCDKWTTEPIITIESRFTSSTNTDTQATKGIYIMAIIMCVISLLCQIFVHGIKTN